MKTWSCGRVKCHDNARKHIYMNEYRNHSGCKKLEEKKQKGLAETQSGTGSPRAEECTATIAQNTSAGALMFLLV